MYQVIVKKIICSTIDDLLGLVEVEETQQTLPSIIMEDLGKIVLLDVGLHFVSQTEPHAQIMAQSPAPSSLGLLPLSVPCREPRVRPRSQGKGGIRLAHVALRLIL